jgi:cysteinyl-tRNA synthetase
MAVGTITAMQVYNTLERAVVPLEIEAGRPVTMYVCGPTVQSEPHLGHGRSAVVFDVVRRYLAWLGHDVVFVRNVTDIDDKIIVRAAELGCTTEDVAAEAYAAFSTAYDRLGNLHPTVEPRATEHIPEMIALIERLIDGGHAYATDGDVYFAVRSFDRYGRLSRHDLDDLRAGERVEVDERKRDPLDFALWKASKPGEPRWDSPWGAGRPGWHIECSAMAARYLGESFDIHGGGADLIFPHHENEIAQSEAATGTVFARYWMHNGMLNLAGEKMAKSTGHVVTLLESLDRWEPLAVRLFYLRTSYRKPLEFSEEALADAEASLGRLRAFRRRSPSSMEGVPDAEVLDAFRSAMDDDLDVAGALAVVFDAVRSGNAALDRGEDVAGLVLAFDEMMGVLGLEAPDPDGEPTEVRDIACSLGVDAASIDEILSLRDAARAQRDWARADEIRDALAGRGIVIEDTPDGARWHRG